MRIIRDLPACVYARNKTQRVASRAEQLTSACRHQSNYSVSTLLDMQPFRGQIKIQPIGTGEWNDWFNLRALLCRLFCSARVIVCERARLASRTGCRRRSCVWISFAKQIRRGHRAECGLFIQLECVHRKSTLSTLGSILVSRSQLL